MPRRIEHDKCACGNTKKIVSTTCRFCYRLLMKEKQVRYESNNPICSCGNKKSVRAVNCSECYRKNKISVAKDRTIGYYWKLYKGTPNSYVHIRMNARTTMERADIKKICKCGYSKHVEVCHIKGISEFSKSAKLKTVNALDNLMYLCPNCHWEHDNEHN